ncbi:lipopolysaccharide biosynthesis protein [Paenibacillus sp. L3-i20]|uniref:lipopolysaccharide biosynthesis protein n=1 Tax=Paenibacillus sp. L3-i20 TaxID=2905833 RepID=UPI001EDF4120|nr:oligosaccharide flippase family protein [Paenibacillus sp. L3-i20]GKU75830.1 flippase [Paenibacillus sp. L3-i20]
MSNQFKTGAVLSYVTIILSNVVGLIYTPIMLRMLGQSEYGLYSLVGSMIATLSLIDLGFGNASIRYLSKHRALGDKDKEYNMIGMFMVINTAICVLTIVAGYFIYQYALDGMFGRSLSGDEFTIFKVMFLLLVFNLAIGFPFSVFGSVMVSHERFVFAKVIGLIRTILNPIVILAVLYMGHKSLGMVIANTVINVLFLWVNVYYCMKVLKIKVYFKQFDWKEMKEIFVYSGFTFLAIIVDKIYWTKDQMILGSISGSAAVSVYAIAAQLNMYYMQLSTAISGMFLPRVTSIVVKDSDEKGLSELFVRVGRIQYIILGLMLSGLILFGKAFIVLWAGPAYSEAYIIALILIGPFTVPLIQNMGLIILQAQNRLAFRSIMYLIIALGNLAVSIPLAKAYGGIGCAIGTGASMIIGNIIIINIYYYKKIGLDIPAFWREIGKMTIPISAILLLGAGINLIAPGQAVWLLIVKIVLFMIIYCVIMYIAGMNAYEKGLIRSVGRIIVARKKKVAVHSH